VGDLLGDWREELLVAATDGKSLRLCTTALPTIHRQYTLMHDPQYRLGIAWQNVAYNKPAHPGFYLGSGMVPSPGPAIELVKRSAARNP
jgi:rhamnogalacturonan endolyase